MEHIEDIIIREGTIEAVSAIQDLKLVINRKKSVTVKYDGRPVIVFGHVDGKFVMNDKNRFFAKTYNGVATSTDELRATILRRKADTAQSIYAEKMCGLFDELKRGSYPKKDTLYVAEVLWFESDIKRDELTSRTFVKPNVVEYNIPSFMNPKHYDYGLIVHTVLNPSGLVSQCDWNELPAFLSVYMIPPVSMHTNMHERQGARLCKKLDKIAAEIRDTRVDLSASMKKTIYSYYCRNADFSSRSYKTFIKELKAAGVSTENEKEIKRVMMLINRLNHIKNVVVDELDIDYDITEGSRGLKQTRDGQIGGEGYVVERTAPSGRFKLVKRDFRRV